MLGQNNRHYHPAKMGTKTRIDAVDQDEVDPL
jgi:hypothetical protein